MFPARVGIAGLICAELAEELRLELYGCRKFYTVKVYIEGLFACIVIQTSSMAAHWCHLLVGENERTPIIQGKKKYKARPQHLFWLYCSVWPGLWAECRPQLLRYCWLLN